MIAEESSPALPALEAEPEPMFAETEPAFEAEEKSFEPESELEPGLATHRGRAAGGPPGDSPVAKARRARPARTLEQQRNGDIFDLRSLVSEVEAEPEPANHEDNLEALFDEIQLED